MRANHANIVESIQARTNSSQTQHHRSETKRKEKKKIEAFQSRKKIGNKIASCRMQDAGSRKQETVANGTVAAGSEHSAFRYGIAKISNFARIAKLGIFARLAKFR